MTVRLPAKRKKPVDYAAGLASQLGMSGLKPLREYRLFATYVGLGPGIKTRMAIYGYRDFRFDLAFPAERLAVDIQGGGWIAGHHSRGAGMEDDCEKISGAVALGWRVLLVTPKQVKNGRALGWIMRALGLETDKRELWRKLI